MTPETTLDELAAALELCASELLWEAGVARPPVDTFAVAGRLGLLVAEDAGLSVRGRYARLQGASLDEAGEGGAVGVILLGHEERRERRHWSVAHEIGEAVAQRVFERLGVTPDEAPPSAREQVANGLASRLLLPRRWFAQDGAKRDWDLRELKTLYETASHELIARRTLELITSPAIVTILDHGEVTWRRTNFGRRAPEMLPEEFAVWRECHEDAIPTETRPRASAAQRVRAWPVHEPGWRREILLAELPAWE